MVMLNYIKIFNKIFKILPALSDLWLSMVNELRAINSAVNSIVIPLRVYTEKSEY